MANKYAHLAPDKKPKASLLKMCGRKARFNTKSKADNRAKEILDDGGPHMRSYHCALCNRHHLTRRGVNETKTR